MVVVGVMVIAAIPGHHDHGSTIRIVVARIKRMMVMVMVVVVINELGLLHSRLHRRLRLIDSPQERCSIRDRLQQFGERISPKNFGRVLGWRGLGRIQAAERGDSAQ